MFSWMWSTSLVALLVMDARTGALTQGIHYNETQPLRCHQCSPTNSTSCEEQTGWLSATCPGARPYCSTVVTGPDFSSWLGCSAATDAPCSLTSSPTQTLELTCICSSHLCNAPFTNKLRNELLNFSSNTNESALTEVFFKLSKFANVSEADVYKAITVEVVPVDSRRNVSEVTTLGSVSSTGTVAEMLPVAQAVKQQGGSEDDEDEGEGSGLEEPRARLQDHSAPPAPSSFLPAHENTAHILTHFSIAPLLLTHLLL